MSISDENNKTMPKTEPTEKVEKALEESKIKKLTEETELMDNLQDILRSLTEAERRDSIDAINSCRADLNRILSCLGTDTKETLEAQYNALLTSIKEDGATAYNTTLRKNYEVKLRIIDRREEIIDRLYPRNRKEKNHNSAFVAAGVSGVLIGAIIAAGAIRGCSNDNTNETTVSDTAITTTETSTDPTTEEPTTVSQTTTGLSLETVGDDGYTSPTTTTDKESESNGKGNTNGNGNNKGTGNKKGSETKKLRETKSPTATSWISKPTSNKPKETKHTTSTVETKEDGTPKTTKKIEVKPSGTDKLPVEPKTTKKATSTPKPTKKPTATPKPTRQTVDPDDENNVVEKCAAVVETPVKITFGDDFNIIYSVNKPKTLKKVL